MNEDAPTDRVAAPRALSAVNALSTASTVARANAVSTASAVSATSTVARANEVSPADEPTLHELPAAVDARPTRRAGRSSTIAPPLRTHDRLPADARTVTAQ